MLEVFVIDSVDNGLLKVHGNKYENILHSARQWTMPMPNIISDTQRKIERAIGYVFG